MTTGYDLYSISRTSPTRSFEIPTGQRFVKMAKFAENGTAIVGGSDHGCVYVFKVTDSEPRQVLYHERTENMIQTIAVSRFRNGNSAASSIVVQTISSIEENIIASGSSDGQFAICLWRKPVSFLRYVS